LRENIVDVFMEMKFIMNIYSQAFHRVGPGYRELAKFIIVDQCVGFPGEGYNFGSFPPQGRYIHRTIKTE
jgi:hypothetical protein